MGARLVVLLAYGGAAAGAAASTRAEREALLPPEFRALTVDPPDRAPEAAAVAPQVMQEVADLLKWALSAAEQLGGTVGVEPPELPVAHHAHSAPPALVIDLRRFNKTKLVTDEATGEKLVRCGYATPSHKVTLIAKQHDRGAHTSRHYEEPMGPFLLNHGWGHLTARRGWALDHVAETVIAWPTGELKVLRGDFAEHADLHHSVRGTGSNFGIPLRWLLRLHERPEVVPTALVATPLHRARHVSYALEEVADEFREGGYTAECHTEHRAGGGIRCRMRDTGIGITPDSLKKFHEAVRRFKGMAAYENALPRFYNEHYHVTAASAGSSYGELLWGTSAKYGPSRSAFLPQLFPGVGDMVEKHIEGWMQGDGGGPDPQITMALSPTAPLYKYGGHPSFYVATQGGTKEWTAGFWNDVKKNLGVGFRPLFYHSDEPHPDHPHYPPETMQRLCKLKHQLDPGNVLRHNRNIPPCPDHPRDPPERLVTGVEL